jgi:transposase
MEYIGIDVHQRESQVCIVDEHGQVLVERRFRTSRERLAELFGTRARARVLLEASTESEWVAHALEGLGHEVIVADPNFALMYATRSRRVKTDRRDARALADASRLGAYRPAHRTSAAQRTVRAQLAVREALVRTRTRYISVIRAVLRRDGVRVPSGGRRDVRAARAGAPPVGDSATARRTRQADVKHTASQNGRGGDAMCALVPSEHRKMDGVPLLPTPLMRRRPDMSPPARARIEGCPGSPTRRDLPRCDRERIERMRIQIR